MATSIQVLAPNGRRQNVKVTPNTSILQIIEQVCTKQGFPPEEYDLKHQRTILDVNSPVRYSNLPNNAKVELVKTAAPRKETEVNIALQLESNERLQHAFLPSTSLWQILEHWDQQQSVNQDRGKLTQVPDESSVPSLQPVCIYMRQEVIGEKALKRTTLKSLGLTSGRAIIRFLHRAVELPQEVETAKQPTKKRSNESMSSAASSSTPSLPQKEEPTPMDVEPSSRQTVTDSRTESSTRNAPTASVSPSEPMEVGADGEIKLTPQQEEQAMIMGRAIAQSIFQHRQEEEERQQQQQLEQQRQQELRRLREQERQIRQRQQELVSMSARESFTDFKFPEETKGQTLFVNELSSMAGSTEPCDRELIVYNPDIEDRSVDTKEDVPDEFFDVTVSDVRRMYADLQQERQSLEEQPMLTKSQRETHAIKMIRKYPKIVIRIHFPDRLVLQGIFRPLETVKALTEFVQSNLEDKNLNFYLYTTPPKCILKDPKQTLYAAKLIPAANVYFGSETSCAHYLLSSLLGEAVTPTQADVKFALVRSTSQVDEESSEGSTVNESTSQTKRSSAASPPSATSASASDSASTSASSSSSKGTVPKWFKMGGKK
ncbi:tether containing UBX domain for GLUT4-like [Ptychodera flava]|uniref:tether containing UBX domain for GLUT4-like n=1 Tax=Ptychodera flava TaxID=63121 RepID=UPI00396A8C2B